MWIFATAILVVYSFMTEKYFSSNLGFITMIALLTTDVLLYFIVNADIVKTSTPLALTLFVNRFFLVIFGPDYWVFGYICIYIFYGILLSVIIAIRRFPLEDEVGRTFNIDKFALEVKQKAAPSQSVAGLNVQGKIEAF